MDALVCNGLGIILGIQTLKYFSMKTYYWRGLWNIPTYRYRLFVNVVVQNFYSFLWQREIEAHDCPVWPI